MGTDLIMVGTVVGTDLIMILRMILRKKISDKKFKWHFREENKEKINSGKDKIFLAKNN